jgi:hypothetical protein
MCPADGSEVQDTPKLTIVVMDPETEWSGQKAMRDQIADWTKRRGKSDRLYPAALVWCFKKTGRDFREKVELWLAWKRVAKEVADGTLGADYDKADRADIDAKVRGVEDDAKDEVWGSYRFVVVADSSEADGLKVIDLGAGHASARETLCGRVILSLKAQNLLNESVGAGYIERNWPKALKESGAWPLSGLRQSLLNGSLTRLLDPDATLRGKIPEFVLSGDLGLASGPKPDGTYDTIWFEQSVSPDEVMFDANVFLLSKAKAKALKSGTGRAAIVEPEPNKKKFELEPEEKELGKKPKPEQTVTLRVIGDIPSEVWNRLGTKVLPKLKSGADLKVGIEFTVNIRASAAGDLESDLKQILSELGLGTKVRVERV